MTEQVEVKKAKELHKQDVLSKPNVVGVGTGYRTVGKKTTDELCVVALVRRKIPKAGLADQDMVPSSLDGVKTDVIEVGDIRPQQTPTDRWRPAPGGVSLGHYQITAGTFGCVVRDQGTGDRLILSNNHVIANSNDASIGDPVLQPGPADGGQTADDTIAHLERFCPIVFSEEPGTCNIADAFASVGNFLAGLTGSKHHVEIVRRDLQAVNLVDAAVARPIDDSQILDEILEIGTLTDITLPILGMSVRKSGRTTGLTTGTINVIDTTVDVSYGIGRTARFENQIVSTAMSQGGDSGSCLVDGDSELAVGLLFAGSDQATIFNPIEAVFDCLDVML
ncbi:MAG: hypothetical protein R3335_09280 [Anaerolineales bacterium]|nr:hypothetical protein [Anaerolineales bacterium]